MGLSKGVSPSGRAVDFAVDETGVQQVDLTDAQSILGVDVQSHLTSNTVAINAVALTISTGATPNSTSAAIQTDGWNELNILCNSSVSHTGFFQVIWSYDNINFTFKETPATGTNVSNPSSATTDRWATLPVKAPYCKIYFANQDTTNAPTVTVQAYLKA